MSEGLHREEHARLAVIDKTTLLLSLLKHLLMARIQSLNLASARNLSMLWRIVCAGNNMKSTTAFNDMGASGCDRKRHYF